MRKTTIILSFLMLSGLLQAQDNTPKRSGWKVTSFSVSMGFAGVYMTNTNSDYNNLKNSVEDPDLFIDPAGFSHDQFYSGAAGNGSFRISMGLTPYSKKHGKYRNNRELRFRVGSNIGIRHSFSFYQDESFPVDTFYSANGRPDIYADSVQYSGYGYDERFTDINFGISYLFKTDVQKRVFLYTGVGAEYGITLNYYVTVDQYEGSSVYYHDSNKPEDHYPYNYYYAGNGYTSSTNDTKMKTPAQFVRAFIPLGIDFRISNHNSFFKHVHLFTEFNPGVEFQILGGQTGVNPYFGVALMGLRYKFLVPKSLSNAYHNLKPPNS